MSILKKTALSLCLTMLFTTIIVESSEAREPAQLRVAKLSIKPARVPESIARKLAAKLEYSLRDGTKKMLSSEKLTYAQIFDGSSVELNGDSTPELLITANPERVELPMHNPPVWIFGKVNGKYKQIFTASGSAELLRTKTSGYTDLRNFQHCSVAESEIAVYKFSHGAYRLAQSYTQTFLNPNGSVRRFPQFIEHN